MNIVDKLHQKALTLSKDFKRVESELISILMDVEKQRVFEKLGFTSMFDYCTRALGLSESHSYSLISVARKSVEVPTLKSAIESGKLHLSNARRIVAVLCPVNQQEWIEKATSLTQREPVGPLLWKTYWMP